MRLSPNAALVWDYIKEMKGSMFTAADIANATGVGIRAVNGVITAGGKEGLIVRTPATIRLEDGKLKTVSFISMTDKGYESDPERLEK